MYTRRGILWNDVMRRQKKKKKKQILRYNDVIFEINNKTTGDIYK